MENIVKAVSKYLDGHTCSQAIVATYGPEYGITEDVALKLSCPFGGGMGKMGLTCGAVTGSIMVIGLKYGRVVPMDIDSREMTDSFVGEFCDEFIRRNKSIVCNELIGCDRSTTEGEKYARENGIFAIVCPKLVKDAAEILENILE
jgi:C_GCAxxG_C_C family probable redox protein